MAGWSQGSCLGQAPPAIEVVRPGAHACQHHCCQVFKHFLGQEFYLKQSSSTRRAYDTLRSSWLTFCTLQSSIFLTSGPLNALAPSALELDLRCLGAVDRATTGQFTRENRECRCVLCALARDVVGRHAAVAAQDSMVGE